MDTDFSFGIETMRMKPGAFAILILVVINSGTAYVMAYGNGSSFTMLDASAIAYSDANYAPTSRCSTSLIETNSDLSIISATLVAQEVEVPEHCLVYGVISPEIQFVVQLPVLWNGRLYVHGNGAGVSTVIVTPGPSSPPPLSRVATS